jgi:hypothetical protein
MFLKMNRASRRRRRKEKLLRLNNEAKQNLQSKEGEKVDRKEKEKTEKNRVQMNAAGILKMFTFQKNGMKYSNQSDKLISDESLMPVKQTTSKMIPQGKLSPAQKLPVQVPMQEPTELLFIEPVRLLLPRTSCTVNLRYLGSSHNSQSRWVRPGRERKSSCNRPMNCSMISRTSRSSRSSTSSRSRRERKTTKSSREKSRKILEETCQVSSLVVSPFRQTYRYKTVYPGII